MAVLSSGSLLALTPTDIYFWLAMSFKYERIDKHKAILLVVDHQEGLFQISRDQNATVMKQNILAHAELAKIFQLPTILTTSAEQGTGISSSPTIILT